MIEIATRPSKSDWFASIIVCPIFVAIGAIPPLLVVSGFYIDSPTGRTPKLALAGCLVIGAILALWFSWRTLNRFYWHLTEAELIVGRWGRKHFALSTVDRVVLGLPPILLQSGLGKLVTPEVRHAYTVARASSLLLIFKDESLLPLTINHLPNGTALIDELMKRLQNRVMSDHVYTEEQIKRLRGADPNVLISKPKSSSKLLPSIC
ncbi:MAG: hypothetical protein HZA89_16010 [Verrucomicrobia bacterium]|nr:hypothetical protein [Verrucomicrobiota bacterium]